MRSNKLLIGILVVLVAVAVFIVQNNKSGTLGKKEGVLSDFAIDDTTSINKIFMADADGEQVTLTKSESGTWLVDGKYNARPESISILMQTFNKIAVKSPLPKAAHNNVVTEMAAKATKVEVYQGGDAPSKVYYVGNPTNDHMGTYMLLELDGVKSSEPFIMHIPGFYGFLTTRFFASSTQWRDALIYNYQPDEIKRVELKYFETPEESFVIENQMNKISLYSNGEAVTGFDTAAVLGYLNSFKKIYYENAVQRMTQHEQDSVINTTPYFSIKVKDIYGVENQMVAYHMPNFKGLQDNQGNVYPYNLDRMYGHYNNELLVLIQFRTFDQLTLPLKHFMKP